MDILKARAKAKAKPAGKPEQPETAAASVTPPAAPPAAPEAPAPEAAARGKAPKAKRAAAPPPAEAPAAAGPEPAVTAAPAPTPPAKPAKAAAPAAEPEEAGIPDYPALDLPDLVELEADSGGGEDGQNYDEEEQFLHSYAAQATRVSGARKYLTFEVGPERYGLLLTDVRETIKLSQMTLVPRSPRYLAGLISLRGTMVPVIDLRHRLGLDAAPLTRQSRIVVCESAGHPVGFIVDRIHKVVDMTDADLQSAPANLTPEEQEVIEGVGRFRALLAAAAPGRTGREAAQPRDSDAGGEEAQGPAWQVEFFTLLRVPALARIEFGGSGA